MSPEQLLDALARRGVRLNAAEDRVRFRAPEGAVDEELRTAVREHKGPLAAALRDRLGFTRVCPLSYNQLSLFILHLLDPQSAAYNLAIAVRFRSPVDAARLRGAVESMVLKHGQLRTTYTALSFGDRIIHCQLEAEELPPGFEERDALGLDEEELRRRVHEFYAAPLDLETGPIVQAALFRRGEAGDVFVLKLHHIAADGWSLNLIAEDLENLLLETPSPVASDEHDGGGYEAFSLGQREFLRSQDGLRQLEYWQGMHSPPAPGLNLGAESRRPAVRRPAGATLCFEIEEAERGAIEECAKKLGITSFALLLSAFQAFLFRRSGQKETVVGIPTLGPRSGAFRNTVGYFINPVALRCRRELPVPFGEHAKQTTRELAEALDNRDAPFAAVVERIGGARDPSRTPVFQAMFNMLSEKTLGKALDLLYRSPKETVLDFCGINAEAYPLNQQEGQFDLTLELIDRGRYLTGLFKYCTDLFDEGAAGEMLRDFRDLLTLILRDPEDLCIVQGATEGERTESAEPKAEIVLAATFTADGLREPLEFWFSRLGWRAEAVFAPFNQVFQTLLDPSSRLRAAGTGYGVMCIRLDDLAGPKDPAKTIAANLDELVHAAEAAAPALSVPLCVVFCPSSPRLAEKMPEETRLIRETAARLESIRGVHVLTPELLFQWYPVREFYEPLGEELGHIPYTREFFAALSTGIVRSLHALGKKPVKTIAVDCDGTLWEGIAAEDGAEAVVIGPDQIRFQEFLVRQAEKGVILCLCSKNREEDVWAVFDRRPEMAVTRSHVPFWRINWRPKSENLRGLSEEIGIGLDAMAFIDDSLLEREEVRAGCPSVLCVDLPADWGDRVRHLVHLWPLDVVRVTEEDRKRTEHYRSERLRDGLRSDAESFAGFLERLELVVDIRVAEAADHDRLAQLSVRVNQFNTTGFRMTVQDVARYCGTPGLSALTVRVRDRFGDYGLVGAVFCSAFAPVLRVDSLLLSCRALGRGVEHRMAAEIARRAAESGCASVVFPMTPTERNEPARKFLDSIRLTCGGRIDAGGTLGVSAEALLSARFAVEEAPARREADARKTPERARPVWDARIQAIASELQTTEKILAAMEKTRRSAHGGRAGAGSAHTAPVTDVERAIAESWKRALALDAVGTDENFFDIGGTSILLAQVAVDLRRRQMKFSMADLFRYPTISSLARYFHGAAGGDGALDATIRQGERQRAALGARELPAAFKRLKSHRGK